MVKEMEIYLADWKKKTEGKKCTYCHANQKWQWRNTLFAIAL